MYALRSARPGSLVLLAVALLTSCAGSTAPPTAGSAAPSSPTSSAASPPSTPATSPATPQTPPEQSASPTSSLASDCPDQTLAGMTPAQRVGQLVMLGVDAAADPTSAARLVAAQHLGAVTYIGRSYAGTTAMKRTTSQLQQAAGLPLLVATDQEGGQVQVLHGPGFPEMPSALEQGRLAPSDLRADAASWGRALRAAGVNTDLAPVLDVVPRWLGKANQPIGRYDRQYGSTPKRVSRHGLAFARGMQDAGVIPVAKHFPGLGAVRGNTDVTSHVVDTVTGPDSPSLRPFRTAVRAGVPVVMVSSAYYDLIDPTRPAMFSRKVITGLLRDDLGFQGVVITDDVGSAAAAKAYGPVARRAIDFIAAGGDVLLTVDAGTVPTIVAALLTRAGRHPSFDQLIDAAALRVLALKASAGLLTCTG